MNPFKRSRSAQGQLWSSKAEFDERWQRRISIMASFIETPGPVADLGCGMMWLEKFLSPANSYLPVDYLRRDDRTLVLDFNRDRLPDLEARVAFISGALEYVVDAKAFLQRVMEIGFAQIVLSYCTLEKFPNVKDRRGLNWASDLSIYEILSTVVGQYDLTGFVETEARDTIFAFRRKAGA